MATTDEIAELKTKAPYGEMTDADISILIDMLLSVNAAASELWSRTASSQAQLVNTSESGSSRAMGDLHKQSISMAKYYSSLEEAKIVPIVDLSDRPRTRLVVRD